jgi:PAS domain S-box-containing protein
MTTSSGRSWPDMMTRWAGSAVLASGGIVLTGWTLDLPVLKSILPNLPTMSPLTAFALCLGGLSLVAGPPWPVRRPELRWTAAACAGALWLITALRLLAYAMRWNTGIDLLVFHEDSSHLEHVTRMAQGTALALLLVGSALLLRGTRRFAVLFQTLSLGSALIAWLGLSRYVFGGQPLLPFAAMSVHTGVCLLALSVGTFCSRTDAELMSLLVSDSVGGRLTRRLLVPVIVIPPVVSWLSFRAQHQGWFGTEAGVSLLTLSTIVTSGVLIWSAARLLHREDLARRRAEKAGQSYLAIVEASTDAIMGKTLDGIITNWNPGAERIFGYSAAEAVGKPMTMLFQPEHLEEERTILDRISRGERVEYVTAMRVKKGGERVAVSESIAPIRDLSGRVVGASRIVRDISENQRAEVEMRRAQAELQQLLAHSPALIYTLQIKGGEITPLLVSDNVQRLLGYTVEEAASYDWWFNALHPDDRERVVETSARMRSLGGYTMEYRVRHKDGTYVWVEDSNRTLHRDAKTSESVGVWIDITDRKRVAESLLHSEERFRQLAENINEAFWMIDARTHEMLYVSPAYEKIWNQPCESLYRRPDSWLESVHAEDRTRIREAQSKHDSGTYDEEYRIVRPDGAVRWIHDRSTPIRDADGSLNRIVGVAEDVTSRRALEDQYRQAQKMEAVGQLAGGVAHDFNNILTVIQGHCTLLTMKHDHDALLESAAEIETAVRRASNLTRQLLAFSRRQTLVARDLDLNEVVASLSKMLQRILGEDVHMQLRFDPRPLIVHGDAGMLDQVLLNLAVNARDAMPGGGELIIETTRTEFDQSAADQSAQIRPGSFVCLNVTDTGTGIPKDVLPRIFEPFFTTKEVGHGTGLGLATVFGIVKQHGGWVHAYSEIGHGTTFRVYLPRATSAVDVAVGRTTLADVRGGSETILVAEDDPAVRSIVRTVLGGLGYRVLEAPTGVAALEVWTHHRGEVELLLTDLVMPDGMSGIELGNRIIAADRTMRVIYMSGYSPEIAGKNIELHEGANFLAKPFNPKKLAQVVRDTLDVKIGRRSDPGDSGHAEQSAA